MLSLGLPDDAHPPSRCARFNVHHLHGVVDQHRFHGGVERHRLPRGRLAHQFLLHHDCLSHLETIEGGTTAATTLVARAIRSGGQYHLAALPHPDLVLRFLAAVDAGGGEFDELGGGHVLWGYCLVVGILFYLGETFVCGPCDGRETGSVDGDDLMGIGCGMYIWAA